LPVFLAKKEVFQWLSEGKKTIDVRKGTLRSGELAVFLSGPNKISFRVVKTETGQLSDVVRLDNFRLVIPSAGVLEDAFVYLRGIYGSCEGVFTAYYIAPLVSSEKSGAFA
jgi:hypothetical protein